MYASANCRSNILRPVVTSTNEFMTSCGSSVALKTMHVSAITKFSSKQQACMCLQQLNFKANNRYVSAVTAYRNQHHICMYDINGYQRHHICVCDKQKSNPTTHVSAITEYHGQQQIRPTEHQNQQQLYLLPMGIEVQW